MDSNLTLTARSVARDLRDGLGPYADRPLRDILDLARSQLAIAMAEDQSGVSHQEAQLIRIYSRSQLHPAQVEAAKAFGSALISAYHELELDYVGVLTRAEELAGERIASAA